MSTLLNKEYWNDRYLHHQTGWDLGVISTPLKEYIDQLKDKNTAILIPGCGNGYEAEYLLQKGFCNITLIDIAPLATMAIEVKLAQYINNGLQLITGDFFALTNSYDLILEQTFFCALNPSLRTAYVHQMHVLLKPKGKLVGLLFNRNFEGGPPFGGNKAEYQNLFENKFHIQVMQTAYNSIEPRAGTELFIIMQKK
ncbi:MAG: methyltransferase domain-containing protein [Ferruginibacter sp.]